MSADICLGVLDRRSMGELSLFDSVLESGRKISEIDEKRNIKIDCGMLISGFVFMYCICSAIRIARGINKFRRGVKSKFFSNISYYMDGIYSKQCVWGSTYPVTSSEPDMWTYWRTR